jgi:hypothetical protein
MLRVGRLFCLVASNSLGLLFLPTLAAIFLVWGGGEPGGRLRDSRRDPGRRQLGDHSGAGHVRTDGSSDRRAVRPVAGCRIRRSGDVVKGLAAGAATVTVGSLLAGTEESPGLIMTRGGHR